MKKVFILIFSVTVILNYCDKENDSIEAKYIYGSVTNSNGLALSDAIILISFTTTNYDINSSKNSLKKACPTTIIKFDIPDSGYVKLWISRYNSTDTVKILNDGIIDGRSIQWDFKNKNGKTVKNDVYQYHLTTEQGYASKYFLYNEHYHSNEYVKDTHEYFAITDEEGKFKIPFDELACNYGVEIELLNENGDVVSKDIIESYIKIWCQHSEYYMVCMDSIFVDPDKSINVSMKMTNKR